MLQQLPEESRMEQALSELRVGIASQEREKQDAEKPKLQKQQKSTHHPHKIDNQHRECKTGGGAYFAFFLGSDKPPKNAT